MKTLMLALTLCLLACTSEEAGSSPLPESEEATKTLPRDFEQGFEVFLSHQESLLLSPAFFQESGAFYSTEVKESLADMFKRAIPAVKSYHRSLSDSYSETFELSRVEPGQFLIVDDKAGTPEKPVEAQKTLAEKFAKLSAAQFVELSSTSLPLPSDAPHSTRTLAFWVAMIGFLRYELVSAYDVVTRKAAAYTGGENHPTRSPEKVMIQIQEFLAEGVRRHEPKLSNYKKAFLKEYTAYSSFASSLRSTDETERRRLLAGKFSEITDAPQGKFE